MENMLTLIFKNLVSQAVLQADFLKDACLWVDGFSGFTSVEFSILAALLKKVSQAHIALCLDGSRINLNPDISDVDTTSLFYPTEFTYARLLKTFKENKIQVNSPVILEKAVRFTGSKVLSHVDKIFLSCNRKLKCDESVRIISAADRRQGVALVSLKFKGL